MRVFIYAYEDTYKGLHGIYDVRVVDVSSLEEANEYGMVMSGDVIESYGIADENFDEDEYEAAFSEACMWDIYPIDEKKAKGLSIEELDKLASDWGKDLFIKKYCGEMF